MIPYKNLNRNSDVTHYEIASSYVKVKFRDDSVYTYTYARTGARRVGRMKFLARRGWGLNTYINDYVYKEYSSKKGYPPRKKGLDKKYRPRKKRS